MYSSDDPCGLHANPCDDPIWGTGNHAQTVFLRIAIGRASRPFPRSKPSRHLSMHSAFQLHLCTSRQWVSGDYHSRTHQHLSAPSSAFPSSPFLSDVRQVSPGRPSPYLRHYNRAFGYYAASALLSASWHFRFHYWLGGPGVPKFLHPL